MAEGYFRSAPEPPTENDSKVSLLTQYSLGDNSAVEEGQPPKTLRLGQLYSSVKISVSCLDMTLSGDGTILTAGWSNGMLEYDKEGKQISAWLPPEDLGTAVATLETLNDGQVAVGVYWSHLVVLLRCQSSVTRSWREDKRIECRALPRHIAAYCDLLAVAGSRDANPGYELDIAQASDGRLRASRAFEFAIIVTALTASTVIVSTGHKRRLDGSYGNCVEAYSYRWEMIWQTDVGDGVWEIWPQPQGHVVSVGLGKKKVIKVISNSKGKYLEDMQLVDSARNPPGSEGITMSYDARRAHLAVMPADGHTVEFYPVSGYW